MIKYIDAEKLKAEIERLREINRKALEYGHITDDVFHGRAQTLNYLFEFIDSLQQEQDLIVINKKEWEIQEKFLKNKKFGMPLKQEQPEELLESQQEYVDIVTERILKEGPIPTLKGKAKTDFEKEFNRFKQISGLMNWPQYMEVYKRIILWFMAWGADRLPNLGKPIVSDEIDL